MNEQIFFDFKSNPVLDINSFFVNRTNEKAFSLITNGNFLENIILVGPRKSGKSHLANIWKNNKKALIFKNNIDEVISQNNNVLIENLFYDLDEEKIFYLINHCISHKLNVLVTSDIDLYEYNFNLPDLLSRLKIFNYVSINKPDDEILINVLTKLLMEKQFIIKNKEIFEFLLKRVNRTYEDIYNLVIKMDKLSLERKRQLTIPLIRELI